MVALVHKILAQNPRKSLAIIDGERVETEGGNVQVTGNDDMTGVECPGKTDKVDPGGGELGGPRRGRRWCYCNHMVPAWYEDTDPKALKVFIELHRRMTEGERLARMFEMCEFQEALQTASVRSMYPEADARELFLRVAERRLGPELTRKAYGWSSE